MWLSGNSIPLILFKNPRSIFCFTSVIYIVKTLVYSTSRKAAGWCPCRVQPLVGSLFYSGLSQKIRRQWVRRSSDVQPSTVSAINTGSKDPPSGPRSACPSPPQVARRAGKQSKKQQQQRQRFYLWSSLIEVYRGVLAVSERASAQAPCWNWQQVELWHVSWEHGSASRRFGAVVVFADSAN